MAPSLKLCSNQAIERQRCMAEWVGRRKRDEDEIEFGWDPSLAGVSIL